MSNCFSPPFHTQWQMGNLSKRLTASNQQSNTREQQPWNMSQLMGALPLGADQFRNGQRPGFPFNNLPGAGCSINLANLQYIQQVQRYGHRGHDPVFLPPAQDRQPQHHPMQPYGTLPGHYHPERRQHPMHPQTQPRYGHVDPYNYALNYSNLSPIGGQVPYQLSPTGYALPTGFAEMCKYGFVYRNDLL